MPDPVTAIIAGVGTVGGAFLQKEGVEDAAQSQQEGIETSIEAQLQAQREAQDFLREQYGITKEMLDPFIEGAAPAFQQQLALVGAKGPEAEQAATENLLSSPTAKWLQETGEGAIDRRASATGQLGGSERLRQISRFNQNLASQLMGQRFNQLGALTGVGLNAASALSGVGQGTAAGQANIAQQTGANLGNLALQSGQVGANLAQQKGGIYGGLFTDLAGGALGYMGAPKTYGLGGGGYGTVIPGSNFSMYTPPGG